MAARWLAQQHDGDGGDGGDRVGEDDRRHRPVRPDQVPADQRPDDGAVISPTPRAQPMPVARIAVG